MIYGDKVWFYEKMYELTRKCMIYRDNWYDIPRKGMILRENVWFNEKIYDLPR